jgi:hypothetical protein
MSKLDFNKRLWCAMGANVKLIKRHFRDSIIVLAPRSSLASFLLEPACDAARTGKQHPNIELLPRVPTGSNDDVGVVESGRAYNCGEGLVKRAGYTGWGGFGGASHSITYKRRDVPPMREAPLADAVGMAESIMNSPGSEDAGFFLYARWPARRNWLCVTLVLSVDKAVTLNLSNVENVLHKKLFRSSLPRQNILQLILAGK